MCYKMTIKIYSIRIRQGQEQKTGESRHLFNKKIQYVGQVKPNDRSTNILIELTIFYYFLNIYHSTV